MSVRTANILGIGFVMGIVILMLLLPHAARGHDPHQHPALKGWADQQDVTNASRPRFNCQPTGRCSCCDQSEIVKTKFRVDRTTGEDVWEWFDAPFNKWRQIPGDIVHWGKHAPNGDPVLFLYQGKERCFFPPEEGL